MENTLLKIWITCTRIPIIDILSMGTGPKKLDEFRHVRVAHKI